MRSIDQVRDAYGARGRAAGALLGHRHRDGRRRRGRHVRPGQGHADGIPAGGRSGRVLRRRAIARRRLGRRARTDVDRAGRGDLKEEPAVADCHLGRRPELHRQLFAAERRLHGRHAQAVRGAQERRSLGAARSSRGSATNSARSRAARWCRWRRRRSSASAPAAASPMCWRICAAAIPRRWRRWCAA